MSTLFHTLLAAAALLYAAALLTTALAYLTAPEEPRSHAWG